MSVPGRPPPNGSYALILVESRGGLLRLRLAVCLSVADPPPRDPEPDHHAGDRDRLRPAHGFVDRALCPDGPPGFAELDPYLRVAAGVPDDGLLHRRLSPV